MANIMSMADIKNRPSRNGFDLSTKRNFTAKVGELLPVWHTPVLPGDKVNINLKSFTRTQPLNTAAFARMREYYDFYFVPYELLWNKFGTAITQMNSNVQHASGIRLDDNKSLSGKLPYVTAEQIANYLGVLESSNLNVKTNPFGFSRLDLTVKLLEYLGYGDFSGFLGTGAGSATWNESPLMYNLEFSLFPLLAYQKIYADYYRYTQWERANPSTFNVDYIKGTNDLNLDISGIAESVDFSMFDLRYCNYQKDLFHGVIPVAQYGSAATMPFNTQGKIVSTWQEATPPVPTFTSLKDGAVKYNSKTGHLYVGDNADDSNLGLRWSEPGLKLDPNATFNLTVLALRQAEFLQKWKEVAVSGEEDYKSQIQKHWGVSVSEFLSGQCRYLGGTATSLDINEVVNNNITGDNAADIAGKGTFANGGSITFESRGEYGIIMCIYHALPIVDYVGSGVNPSCTLVDATSYPIPEMDKVGMELVPLVRAMNPKTSDKNLPSKSTFLGYAPRYINWKTDIDKSVGAFTKTLRTWCLPMGDKELSAANSFNFSNNPNVEPNSVAAGFFKVNPSIVDSLFGVKADSTVDTDHLLCSSFFDVKCVRNLDTNGLPY